MKRLFFLVILFTTILVSCKETESPIVKDLTIKTVADTTIGIQIPKTAPRWSCTGKQLSQKKLIGYDTKYLPIELSKTVTLSGDSLQKAGWYYYKENNTLPSLGYIDFIPDWFQSLLVLLFWVLVFLLCLWVLIQLLKFLWNSFKGFKTIEPDPSTNKTPTSDTAGKNILPAENKNTVTFPSGNNNVYIFIGGKNEGDIYIGYQGDDPNTKPKVEIKDQKEQVN